MEAFTTKRRIGGSYPPRLALRHMELPVGQFITDGLEKGVPDAARTLLEMNVDDERNHDLALGYAALAHGTDEKAEAEAKRLHKSLGRSPRPHHLQGNGGWEKHLLCYPPHVPLPWWRWTEDGFRRYLRDEQVHVATNSLVCRELGLDYSNSLDKLRKATMSWLLEPLGTNTQDKYLDKKFWFNSSDNLMYTGKAPEFSVTPVLGCPPFLNILMSTSHSTLETLEVWDAH